jgi:transposase
MAASWDAVGNLKSRGELARVWWTSERESAEDVPMARRAKRSFTSEFKAEAVKQVLEGGKGVLQAAKELDLTPSSLRQWVQRVKEQSENGFWGALNVGEREELRKLRAEVKRLRMERDFLKKATAFFAKDRR